MTPISPATSPTSRGRLRDCHGGFTLMEVVLALTIVGMLAALAVPYFRPGVGIGALRARANEIASLMRRDRNMALNLGRENTVSVDVEGGAVRSERLGQSILIPAGIELRFLPDRASGVTFQADGSSSGGRIVLSARGAAVAVDVNRLTAAVLVSGIER